MNLQKRNKIILNSKIIWHISDIHIKEGQYDDILYAVDKLVDEIKKNDNISINHQIVIIAGDIFENKNKYSQFDLSCFHSILQKLNFINILIIPGNHDFTNSYNKSNYNEENVNLISAALKNSGYKNIYLFNDTGIYNIPGFESDFYVLSPIDEKDIMPIRDANKMKICILHEPIKGCRLYGSITIDNKARFDTNDFNCFDIIIAGDIHKHQIIGNKRNIVYSGSLIQKNKGEDLNHGCVKWTIDETNKTFNIDFIKFKINNAYLKVLAQDNNIIFPRDDLYNNVKYVEFKHDKCTSEKITDFIEQINKKYGKLNAIIDGDINNSIKNDSLKNTELISKDFNLKISDNELQLKLLEEELTDNKYKQEIIDIHKNFLKDHPENVRYKWKLNYLYWSNIFCYGEDNFIDFEKIEGINSIIGKNKTGKSSIIDILIFILYNKLLRGSKKTIMNFNSKTYKIICGFSVLNSHNIFDKYIIYRSGTTSGKTISHDIKLFKEKQIISSSDIHKTYDILENIIGTHDEITNINISTQNNISISSKKDEQQAEEFRKYFNLDKLETIEESVKKILSAKKSEKKALESNNIKPVVVDNLDLPAINNKILDLNEKIPQRELDLKEKRREKDEYMKKLENFKDINYNKKKYESDINDLDETLYTSYDLHEYEERKKVFLTNIILLKNNIDKNNTEIENLYKSYNQTIYSNKSFSQIELNNQDIISSNDLVSTEQLIEEVKKLKSNNLSNSEEIQVLYGKIGAPKLTEVDNKILEETSQNIEKKIKDLSNLLFERENEKKEIHFSIPINYKPKTGIPYEELKKVKYLSKDEPTTLLPVDSNFNPNFNDKLKFNESCDCCKNNRKTLMFDINQKNMEIFKKNKEIERKIDVNNDKIYYLNDEIKKLKLDIDKYKSAEIIISNKKIRNTISTLEKNTNDNNFQIKKINDKYHIISKINEYNKYKSEDDNNKNIMSKINNIKSENNKISEKILVYENITKFENNLYYLSKIKILDESINKYEKTIKSAYESLSNLKTDKIKLEKYEDTNKKITNYLKDIEIYKTYHDCINVKTGIPYKMLKNYATKIENNINNILNDITDFKVKLNFSSKSFKINILSDNHEIPISQGSGFQSFIIDLSMRLTLSFNHPYLPGFFIIDEGFGCMDQEHLNNTTDFMKNLQNQKILDWILVISHIEELHYISDNHIKISKESTGSKIVLGDSSIIDLSMFNISIPVETRISDIVLKDDHLFCNICNTKLKLGKNESENSTKKVKHVNTKKHIKNLNKQS